MRDAFLGFASRVTTLAGSPFALLLAAAVIGVWLVSGPIFGFSDTWQLVINTATTIVTFLRVFVIQATTNREMRATQIKLDELIRAVKGARNAIIATDLIPEEEVEALQREYEQVGERAHAQASNGRKPPSSNGTSRHSGTARRNAEGRQAATRRRSSRKSESASG